MVMKLDFPKQRVLIIDHSGERRKALRNMLYALSSETIDEATTGVAALSRLQSATYDIVLCSDDLGKGKNGQQVLDEARFKGYLASHAIFVMISVEQTQERVLGVLENKPDDYLSFPFNALKLARRLNKHYRRKQESIGISKALLSGNIQRAITICESKIGSVAPDTARYLKRLLAELSMNIGDFNRSEAIYREFLQQRELDWAWLGLGKIALQKHDYDGAEQCFRKSLALQPKLLECYDGLVQCQQARGDLAEAQKTLANALDLSPSVLSRQKKQAQIALSNGDMDTAEKAANMALKLGEFSIHRQPDDFILLAQIQQRQAKTEPALQSLQSLRREFPGKQEALISAALMEVELFTEMDNVLLAEQAYQQAVREYARVNSPVASGLGLALARCSLKFGDDDQAQTILEELARHYLDDLSVISAIEQTSLDFDKNLGQEAVASARKKSIDANNEGVSLFKKGYFLESESRLREAFSHLSGNKTLLVNLLKVMLHNLQYVEYDRRKKIKVVKYLQLAEDLKVDRRQIEQLTQRLNTLDTTDE